MDLTEINNKRKHTLRQEELSYLKKSSLPRVFFDKKEQLKYSIQKYSEKAYAINKDMLLCIQISGLLVFDRQNRDYSIEVV